MLITKPCRATHTYVQQLRAAPEAVFPLLCPVRECDWVNGWDPRLVVSETGVAELDCVFVIGPADAEATWVVTRYEPPTGIEFVKVTPDETVGRITIALRPADCGTAAAVTYAYTALSERGERAVAAFTRAHYESFMREWEDELNHYLETGEKLSR